MNPLQDIIAGFQGSFGYKITITDTTNPVTVALFPAFYKTLGITSVGTVAADQALNYKSVTELQTAQGSGIAAVLDDGTYYSTSGSHVAAAIDANTSIRGFLDFIKDHDMWLTGLTISDPTASILSDIASKILYFGYVSPLNKGRIYNIQLNDFFFTSQNVTTKFNIDLRKYKIVASDMLLMYLSLPAVAAPTFVWTFEPLQNMPK